MVRAANGENNLAWKEYGGKIWIQWYGIGYNMHVSYKTMELTAAQFFVTVDFKVMELIVASIWIEDGGRSVLSFTSPVPTFTQEPRYSLGMGFPGILRRKWELCFPN